MFKLELMRKPIVIFMFFFLWKSFGQTEKLSNEVLNDILKNTYEYSKPKIINKLDSASVEYHLKALIENKKRLFTEKITDSKDSIKAIFLTKDEKKYLINSIRKQYGEEWKQDDFKNYEIITNEESIKYLNADSKNTLVNISNPIFLRNNEIAFVYFANYCCKENGHTDLTFYKKENGIWKIWVYVSSGYF
jgi:hypothetical protein